MKDYSWTYRELTDAAEKELGLLDQHAARIANDDGKVVLRQWAFGVLSFWSAVTIGRQETHDYERLEALADQVGKRAADHQNTAQQS